MLVIISLLYTSTTISNLAMMSIDEKILNEEFAAILLTSKKTSYTAGHSYAFSGIEHTISGLNFAELRTNLKKSGNWVGYFGYDMKNDIENLSEDEDLFIQTPKSWFGQFTEKRLLSENNFAPSNYRVPDIAYVKSNMSKAEYLADVGKIREYIARGDIYQANLTRKFYGEFAEEIRPLEIFKHLNAISPAPYSAFLKIRDMYIISTSPELFIRVDENGEAVTCPIKGSAAKGNSAELSESKKDISENLMITDLMRNDFSKSCKPGSVKVKDLFEVSEFQTIAHMFSTVTGQLKPGESGFDLIKNCFPPGSMTGAPKIRAMQICSELERHKRGIYSGVLGYFAPHGDNGISPCEFSVVIRTLIIKGNKFEFQVGGGITYDSDPEKEWAETMMKAKPIADALGVYAEVERL